MILNRDCAPLMNASNYEKSFPKNWYAVCSREGVKWDMSANWNSRALEIVLVSYGLLSPARVPELNAQSSPQIGEKEHTYNRQKNIRLYQIYDIFNPCHFGWHRAPESSNSATALGPVIASGQGKPTMSSCNAWCSGKMVASISIKARFKTQKFSQQSFQGFRGM